MFAIKIQYQTLPPPQKKNPNKNESKENGGFLYSTLRLIVS
jgi:hypothetical protein